MPIGIDFACHDCKTNFTQYLTDGNYTIPTKCHSKTKK